MLNKFLVDSENTVREMVELAVTNWMGTQLFDVSDHYRRELAILATQLLKMRKKWRSVGGSPASAPRWLDRGANDCARHCANLALACAHARWPLMV